VAEGEQDAKYENNEYKRKSWDQRGSFVYVATCSQQDTSVEAQLGGSKRAGGGHIGW
jgi:hypothetical protein